MAAYQMRVIWEQLGGHVHMNVFTGPDGKTLGKSGDLVMTAVEFHAWRDGNFVTDRVDGSMHIEWRRKIQALDAKDKAVTP